MHKHKDPRSEHETGLNNNTKAARQSDKEKNERRKNNSKTPVSGREKRLEKHKKMVSDSDPRPTSPVKKDDSHRVWLHQTKYRNKREQPQGTDSGNKRDRNLKTCGKPTMEENLTLEEFCKKFEINLTIADNRAIESEKFNSYFNAVKDQLETIDRTSGDIFDLQKDFEKLRLRETWTRDLRNLDLLHSRVTENSTTEPSNSDSGLAHELKDAIFSEISNYEEQFSPWPYRRAVGSTLINSDLNIGGIFTDYINSHLTHFKDLIDPLSPSAHSPALAASKMATGGHQKEQLIKNTEEKDGKTEQNGDLDSSTDSVKEDFQKSVGQLIEQTPKNVKQLRKTAENLTEKIQKMSQETVCNLTGIHQGLGTLARAQNQVQ